MLFHLPYRTRYWEPRLLTISDLAWTSVRTWCSWLKRWMSASNTGRQKKGFTGFMCWKDKGVNFRKWDPRTVSIRQYFSLSLFYSFLHIFHPLLSRSFYISTLLSCSFAFSIFSLPFCPLFSPEAEFLVEKPGTKTGLLPGFFVFSSRHLLPAVRGIFGRLPRFLPGFSSLSRFLPV